MASRAEYALACPNQAELDAFRRAGVNIMALATPTAMQVAGGRIAHDGLFEPDATGERWFTFDEPNADDIVFWNRRTGGICSWSGRVFALGQDIIDDAATYSFDCNLNIFVDPWEWLLAKRDGIVVLHWNRAFDRLRDCPRIAIAEALLPTYRRHMRPGRMPELLVTPERGRTAA